MDHGLLSPFLVLLELLSDLLEVDFDDSVFPVESDLDLVPPPLSAVF